MKKWLAMSFALVLSFSTASFAGEYLMNEEIAFGLRVEFSEPVLITGFGDILTTVEPEAKAKEFVFSGAELPPWVGHWLNWEPESARLVSHLWLDEPSSVDKSTVASQASDQSIVATDAPEIRGQVVLVSTLADEVNGDISNVHALVASPGGNGISLREAILATNNTSGPHTIQFDESLRGGSIKIGSTGLGYLPRIRDGNLLVDGDANRDGVPDVTLDGSSSNEENFDFQVGFHSIAGLFVASSEVTVYRMALENFNTGVAIMGCVSGCGEHTAMDIRDVQVLENRILVPSGHARFGILITSRPAPLRGGGISIENVVISGNTIACNGEMGIYILGGSGGQFENRFLSLVITGNTITGGKTGITVFAGDTASDYMVPDYRPIVYSDENTISDLQICKNTILGSTSSGIHVAAGNFGNRGNRVTDLSILSNEIESSLGQRWSGIDLIAATQAGTRTTQGNCIERVHIAGNTVTGFRVGISVGTGRDHDLTGNTTSTIGINGNTISGFSECGISLYAGDRNAFGETLKDIYVACNNLAGHGFRKESVGIELLGGMGDNSQTNKLSNVRICDNAIRSVSTAIHVIGGRDGARGNTVGPISLYNNSVSGCKQTLSQVENLYEGRANEVQVNRSNSSIQDTSPPSLVSFDVQVIDKDSHNTARDAQITARTKDDQTGASSIVVHLEPLTDSLEAERITLSLEQGTPHYGLFIGTLALEASDSEATWKISSVELKDNACPEPNKIQIGHDALEARGFPVQFSIEPIEQPTIQRQDEFAAEDSQFMKGVVIRNYLAHHAWDEKWKYLNPMEILHRNGVGWVQARLTMAEHPLLEAYPYQHWGDIPCQYEYYQDPALPYVEKTLKQAQDLGFKLNLCFLLSDRYAYSALQHRPPQWEGLGLEKLVQEVYDYCYETTAYLQERGIDIDLYDMGNEIAKGILGILPEPWGEIAPPEDGDIIEFFREKIWAPEAEILKAAIAGVKKADPRSSIVIHTSYSDDAKYFFQTIIDLGVPFDYASISYGTSQWPDVWCGEQGRPSCTEGDRFDESWYGLEYLSDIATFLQGLGKKMIVGEVTYPNADLRTVNLSRLVSEPLTDWKIGLQIPGYPLTHEGQACWIRNMLQTCYKHPNIVGAFYYEPDFFPEACSGKIECFSPGEANGLFASDTAILPGFLEFTSGPHEYPRIELIDESSTSFEWTGRWSHHADTKCVGGASRYSSTTGAKLEIPFNGTGVSLIYVANDSHGIANLVIDGTQYDQVDMFSDASEPVYRLAHTITRSLSPGEHMLTIEVSGEHNRSSSGDTVMIDAVNVLQVRPEGSVPDTTPPSIADFELSSDTVNTSKSHAEIEATTMVSDADSGVAFVGLDLVSPDGEKVLSTVLHLKEGTSYDGVFKGLLRFPCQTEPGIWTINRLVTGDMGYPEQKVLEFTTAQMESLGFPTEITVSSEEYSERDRGVLQGRSLQEAIDGACDGAVIRVPIGVYEGDVSINKSITLVGQEGEQRPWIIGSGKNSPVIAINAEHNEDIVVELKHLTVANAHGYHGNGIEAHGRVRLLLLDVELLNNQAHGCELGDQVQVEFSGCTIKGMGNCGVEFYGSSRGVFENCNIQENGGAGIWIHGSADVEVLRSQVSRNGYTHEADGIYTHNNARLSLVECEVTENRGCGVRVKSSDNIAACTGNTVTRNREGDYCGFSPEQ